MTVVNVSLITHPETRFESDHPFTLHIGEQGRQSLRLSPNEAIALSDNLKRALKEWRQRPQLG